ncbi:MAG: radical SAM protein [Rhodospirillales bacterium]|nr:radical SAM protein [Rhodospirillales bacterium]
MTPLDSANFTKLDSAKFQDPNTTAKGEERAVVALTHLHTLWFNTGTLCNITCTNCYIESSPRNDRLSYITLDDVIPYLDEIAADGIDVHEIGFTGGEPFLNPQFPEILEETLKRGFEVLVLTNAMKPLHLKQVPLKTLGKLYGNKLTFRVSIDHYDQSRHEALRGEKSWEPMLEGLKWLVDNNFNVSIAGRTCWDENDETVRQGYDLLFKNHHIPIDVNDPTLLVLFPEMDEKVDVPEITVACWDILGVTPESMMCATSRMVIKRKGAEKSVVVPCTLLPYDTQFEMGHDLAASSNSVKLNHPHCAKFCVLGGGSCSAD